MRYPHFFRPGVLALVLGLLALSGCSSSKSTVHIVNYTKKPVQISIDGSEPITLQAITGRKFETESGPHRIRATAKDGSLVEELNEKTVANGHYLYKVKGKGWGTVLDCANLYGKGETLKKISVSSGPSTKPGTVVIYKELNERWNFIGNFEKEGRRVLVIPAEGFPSEVRPDARIFILFHKHEKAGKKYMAKAVGSLLPRQRPANQF